MWCWTASTLDVATWAVPSSLSWSDTSMYGASLIALTSEKVPEGSGHRRNGVFRCRRFLIDKAGEGHLSTGQGPVDRLSLIHI